MKLFDIDWQLVLGQLCYDPKSPMIFSTGIFLFLFLGFTLVYNLLDKQTTLRLLFVTLFSYYFYYKSSGFYFFLLFVVSMSDFLIALLIDRNNRKQVMTDGVATVKKPFVNKLLLGLSLMVDIGILVYFKYTNFFGSCWASLTGGTWDMLDIFLPVGVSFFTFQSLSYTFDIYRRKLQPLHNFLDYAFFVSFFPQLVAGPIVRAKDFIPQIRKPLFVSNEMFGRAIFLIICGLIKKAVISDYISVNFIDRVFDQPLLYTGVENLFAIFGYTLQLYCDFSGYSDMAIGIALLLGFRFPKNFDAPFKAQSITEVWRRWHISLSSWLKDYVYISFGGNRHGKLRQYVNLLLTMLIGGLWHGAAFTFILWGGFHGVCLVIEKIYMELRRRSDSTYNIADRSTGVKGFVRTIVTFILFVFAFLYFRAPSISIGNQMVSQVFTNFSPQVFPQWIAGYWGVFILMTVGFVSHFLPSSWNDKVQGWITRCPMVVQALLIVAVIYLVIQIKSSDVQPFIYFQF